MTSEEIAFEEILRLVESENLTPALMIEACKVIELRRISTALKELVDRGARYERNKIFRN